MITISFLVAVKGYVPLWLYRLFRKIQWIIVTWKIRFLKSFECGITDADYAHTRKRVYKDFEIKNLKEYHDFYVQSDALLLADEFENFKNMHIKIYGPCSSKFLSVPGLA